MASVVMALYGSTARIAAMNPAAITSLTDGFLGQIYPEAVNIPSDIIASGQFAPNVEAILAHGVDAVIQWKTPEDIIAQLEAAGLPVIGLQNDPATQALNEQNLTVLARVIGQDARLQSFLALHHARQPEIAAAIADIADSVLLGLAVGRLTIPPPQVIGALFTPGIHADAAPVIWHIRLPRALASLCAGAALALAGAVLQGLLRNPLAGPQTIGVSSGAAFGGALAIVLGLSGLALVGLAFVAGLATVIAVLAVARLADGPHRSEPSVLTVVLAGIVLSALATAGTTLLQHAADPERLLPQIVYWLMGSFAAASPADTAMLAGLLLPLGLLLWGYGLRLDLMSGGED
jgi:ABC-type Fe3+-siderophore transport system permease subunit